MNTEGCTEVIRKWLTLPARQRYEEFKKQFPYVCQRTNLGYIASYLGITLSTLSRLRSNENDKA